MINKIMAQIVPFYESKRANNKIRRKKIKELKLEDFDLEEMQNFSAEDYFEEYEFSIGSKYQLEDKAKVGILVSIISMVFILAILNQVLQEHSCSLCINMIAHILIIFSMAYIIFAYSGFVNVLVNNNVVYKIPYSRKKDIFNVYETTQMNINQNLIRNNTIYDSYRLIRNSLICLFVVVLLLSVPILFSI